MTSSPWAASYATADDPWDHPKVAHLHRRAGFGATWAELVRVPEDLERFVQAKVKSGRFTSPDQAITEAVRLLQQQEEAEEARVPEGIQQGLEDMRAGRTQPLAEAFADIRRDLELPQGS